MKIRIQNWNEFQKRNSIYFTRDMNIKKDLEVFASYVGKRKKYFLVYIDFINYKILTWIENGNYLEIVDNDFSNEYVEATKYISNYQDIDGLLELQMKDVIAKKWMLENNEFFAMILLDRKLAQKIFIENELK